MKRQRFAPHGLLAVGPKAFGFIFDVPDEPTVEMRGDVAVVSIRGPLMHHHEWCFDSYDDIKARVASALERRPKAVVLNLDSPGGLVSGCFETAKELRALAAAAGVPLHAYVDGQATSAAYALACVGASITVPATGIVGSIGVIDTLVDATAQDAMFGVSFRMIASGARKTDGNPHSKISDDAVFAAQQRVDSLAEIFYAHVNAMRPALGVDQVRALEAGLSHGAEAVALGLADTVGTLDDLLAMLASGAQATNEGTSTMSAYDDAVAALREAAEGDGEEAENAKRMLAALEGKGEKPADEPDGDEAPPADGEQKPAEDAKTAATSATSARASVDTEDARLDRIERRQLMATRPDLNEAQRAALAKVPVGALEAALTAIPRGPTQKPAATTQVGGTRGAGQGGTGTRMSLEQANAALGIKEEAPGGIRREGLATVYPALTPAEARAHIATQNGGAR